MKSLATFLISYYIALREVGKEIMEGNCLKQVWDMSEKEIGNYFYQQAIGFAQAQNLPSSLGCFVDAFLIRGCESNCRDKDWLDFFRLQFSIYLLGKKRVCCSLSEGDMIHDYLKDVYHDLIKQLQTSEIPFRGNLYEWFSSLQLDFPWSVEDSDSFFLFS